MKIGIEIYLVLAFILAGCEHSEEIYYDISYNIVLIVGQSNTHSGQGLDFLLDKENNRIKQLGRFGKQNLKIVPAIEPLQHHTRRDNSIGFGLTFSKLFVEYYGNDQNELLLIPCGHGGTGFIDNRWNKGDDLYKDAVSRVKHILRKYPNSTVKAILWHQGERDVENVNYKENLDAFVQDIRADFQNDTIPFILGGMVPYWVGNNSIRIKQQNVIMETPERLKKTGYVDPKYPFLIEKENNELDAIHYNAAGQRELGRRYFQEYIRLMQ